MVTLLTLTELRRLGTEELVREVAEKRLLLLNLRLGIIMRKEKDSGRYQQEKKQLARMLTIQREKEQLQPFSKVP